MNHNDSPVTALYRRVATKPDQWHFLGEVVSINREFQFEVPDAIVLEVVFLWKERFVDLCDCYESDTLEDFCISIPDEDKSIIDFSGYLFEFPIQTVPAFPATINFSIKISGIVTVLEEK